MGRNQVGSVSVDNTALYSAVQKNEFNTVKDLVTEASTEAINSSSKLLDGKSCLYFASEKGRTKIVKALLKHPGIVVNAKDKAGMSALMVAAAAGHTDVIRALGSHPDIDVNLLDSKGDSALSHAAKKQKMQAIHTLMMNSTLDQSTLKKSLKACKDEKVQSFLDWLENGFKEESTLESLLGASALEDPMRMAVLVPLASATEINALDSTNHSFLYAATISDHVNVIEALLKHPDIDVNLGDDENRSPLSNACSYGHIKSVKMLLTHPSVDINMAETKNGCTAFFTAAGREFVELTKLLFTVPGIDINKMNTNGTSPLLDAALKPSYPILDLLLARPDIDTHTCAPNDILTVFHFASDPKIKALLDKYGHVENVQRDTTEDVTEGDADNVEQSDMNEEEVSGGEEEVVREEYDYANAYDPWGDEEREGTDEDDDQRSEVEGKEQPDENVAQEGEEKQPDENVVQKEEDEKPPTIDTAALLSKAMERGSKPWNRGKVSLVGEGRAGKTALANSIVGRSYSDTASTVGINQLTCDVKHIQTGGGGDSGEGSRWGECQKAEKELETALAQIIAENKRRGASKEKEAPPASIVSFMKETGKPVLRTQLSDRTDDVSDEEEEEEQDHASGTSTASAGHAQSNHAANVPTKQTAKNTNAVRSQPVSSTTSSTVTLPATIKSVPIPVTADTQLDEEAVMKTLATINDQKSGLLISLFDFGGQSVFDVIHHLFLTRNGVYALVFNMEWLVTDGPEKVKALRFMRNWLSSIAVHTYDAVTKTTAPVVFVGTRLDKVADARAHEALSTLLHQEFSAHLTWRSVLINENGQDSNGKAKQCFFPVDNKLGNRGRTMGYMMDVVHEAMQGATYTQKEVPLSWFRVMDRMSSSGRNCLSLADVCAIGANCGVGDEEVLLLLSFLNDMGHLMWTDEDSLRDVVILDAVAYLVVPATIIICKLSPDESDSMYHVQAPHKECEMKLNEEWMQLTQRGVLDAALLPILWKNHLEDSRLLLLLMVKFGLLVPLRTVDSQSNGGGGHINGPAASYLVPTLLKPATFDDPSVFEWTSEPYLSCYFVFTLSEKLCEKQTITSNELATVGFLPGGMFERILGKALGWSQDTAVGASIDLEAVMLCKDVAVLSFGRQWFRLVHCGDMHCVRVDIVGAHPIGIQQQLLKFVQKITEECMPALRCFPAVLYSADGGSGPPSPAKSNFHNSSADPLKKTLQQSEFLIPLQQLRQAAYGKSMLVRRVGHQLMSVEQIKLHYSAWLQQYELRAAYDVFISYRWGRHDSDFTAALFDMLTNFSVGLSQRAVEVFLDTKRLREGRQFKSDFAAALTHSLVAVPVVSVDALGRMFDHNTAEVDNVLLEWIIIHECLAAKTLRVVYPILFGTRAPVESLTGGTVEGAALGFFQSGAKDRLPRTVPTATLAQAAKLLAENGIPQSDAFQSYTVHSLVGDMMNILLYQAPATPGAELVGDFAVKMMQLLCDCGEDALGTVVSPVTVATTVVTSSVGASSSMLTSQSMPALSQAMRKLEDLSVAELCALLEHDKLGSVAKVFAAKEVSGSILAFCEDVSDLQDEAYGVSSAVVARGLFKKIVEWKDSGVPTF